MMSAMHALLSLLILAAAPPDVARQCQGELATAPATVRPAEVEYLGTFGRFAGARDGG